MSAQVGADSGARTYLYALIRPTEAPVDAAGIDGAAVRIVATDGIAAVVSTVSAEMFDPATLEERMRDLTWVEAVARAHDAVVTAAARVSTTIPLRLGTTSDDDADVRDLLVDLAPAARRSLERLERRVEYGVQLFATAARAAVPAGAPEAGAAFLRRRRAELQQDEARRTAEAEQAETAFGTLSALAAASRHNRLRETPAGRTGAMLLNAAFLVDEDRVPTFRAAVDELAASFGPDRVVITGPWAPYSFADLEL